jgi:hypothetical protein
MRINDIRARSTPWPARLKLLAGSAQTSTSLTRPGPRGSDLRANGITACRLAAVPVAAGAGLLLRGGRELLSGPDWRSLDRNPNLQAAISGNRIELLAVALEICRVGDL